MAEPIIVTALFGGQDFAWLDGLRRAHFPAGRNVIRAHLTLFHHLPPSVERDLLERLRAEAAGAKPVARLTGHINLGSGVALRVESPVLSEVRARIADAFAECLTPQDAAAWRPHVTIQNKVEPAAARALLAALAEDFEPRPLSLAGLAAWRYLGGPWAPISAFAFGSGRKLAMPA